MRETFHSQLNELREQLAEMCAHAAEAMRSAGQAVRTGDVELARRVQDEDAELDRGRDRCEDLAQQVLALQAPVATDLRVVLSAVYCTNKIERMGDLAAHVADHVRLTHPDAPVPAELADAFAELGRITVAMAERLVELVRHPDACGFAELNETDQKVDALHAGVMAAITAPGWSHGVPSAMSLALLARYYERFADQTVSVAKRLDFAVTGAIPAG
ncbi:MAG: phosphate signaling complex protein PhoU [Actinophytocola sp.]|uniref:phosphate signaling complex protein PhoU n=1 Tax=Actinophytocola sp. TaxID=1872138 RepID=UPI00132391C1|nr:phosphate signaling complex protein PhoU [Actinophytocola sp.]MPZ81576.1 phosphate signaling complex protein PhoU [Actinophytocola sp.]